MKILWVNPSFLHPTTRGGQIRTLEILKRLHQRNEVHYAAYDREDAPGGPDRADEYSTRSYPVQHRIPEKTSPAFALQLAANLFSPLPLAVSRYKSRPMRDLITRLIAKECFDSIVCDFLFPAPNFPALNNCVLFQHNVETMIWQRHYETASDSARRLLFKTQADRMFRYENEVCRKVRHVIAVSDSDAQRMKEMFGISEVSSTPTGVDTEYFRPPEEETRSTDIVFLGSMDWMPNIDGVLWFVKEVLPRIKAQRPETTVAIVGRKPTAPVLDLAKRDPAITVTGTVPDVRPYLWKSRVCVVPLRVGGGTRLKIYEAMAAKVPVVSTTVGAEGLAAENTRELLIADTAGNFACATLSLLSSPEKGSQLADAAWRMVSTRFSWETVTDQFESILRAHRVQ